jgi:hypothetical protein
MFHLFLVRDDEATKAIEWRAFLVLFWFCDV